jgi:hypothetical protein
MLRTRPLAVLLGVSALGFAAVAITGAAARADTPMTCTNPYSGATWQIKIDYDHSTVDSYPAQISDATIAWHDANDGGNYTLDRKSGKLQVIVASSTGGYFLYDNCGQQH